MSTYCRAHKSQNSEKQQLPSTNGSSLQGPFPDEFPKLSSFSQGKQKGPTPMTPMSSCFSEKAHSLRPSSTAHHQEGWEVP